jgi:radical SAM protein with 4Fe4S-binding SPASM domain
MQPIKLFVAGLELTLACPCRCETCGSAGGKPRPDELTTTEWLSVIHDLAELGCQRLAFLGGEPLYRNDWPLLAARAIELDLQVEMITSGIGVDIDTARLIYDTGLASVTVSVDGIREVHDKLRGVNGGFDLAISAIELLDRVGMRVGVTTQINQATLPTLDALASQLQVSGAIGWQLQLTIPYGRARGRNDLAVSPELMPEVYSTIRRLVRRGGLRPFITDNIGYFSDDDPQLRTPPRTPDRCWLGCFAGLRNIGITSNGSVKGCLALPDSMIESNVRQESLSRIWNDPNRFAYNRLFDPTTLSGECAKCPYGLICRGGCTAVAVTLHQKPGISTHCLRSI